MMYRRHYTSALQGSANLKTWEREYSCLDRIFNAALDFVHEHHGHKTYVRVVLAPAVLALRGERVVVIVEPVFVLLVVDVLLVLLTLREIHTLHFLLHLGL